MPEKQDVDFKGTDRLWPAIDLAYREMREAEEAGQTPTSLAARQVDLAQVAGHRPYISADRLLTVAHENHRAFLGQIRAIGFGPNAPFNLLRPVLENSLWVLWLLDPRSSHERRRRGLQFEVQDHKAELAYLEELGRMSDGIEYRAAAARRGASAGSSYRRDAEALGADYGTFAKKINLTDEIPKLEWMVNRYGSDYVRMIVAEWRRLSGYQHTKMWPSMLGSHRTVVAEIQGGAVAHFVASDDGISMAVGTSGLAFLEALRIYTHRCTRPA